MADESKKALVKAKKKVKAEIDALNIKITSLQDKVSELQAKKTILQAEKAEYQNSIDTFFGGEV